MKDFQIKPHEGKLLVLTPGMGAVSTTFMAGVEAVRSGIAKPFGSVSQMQTIRLGQRSAEGKKGAEHFFYAREENRARARRLYVKLEKTKEWAENNYYRLPIDVQNSDLVTVNAFWHDYAQHDKSQPFFSVNWPAASRNYSEMMFALS